jgi:hypothetical protein
LWLVVEDERGRASAGVCVCVCVCVCVMVAVAVGEHGKQLRRNDGKVKSGCETSLQVTTLTLGAAT